MNINYISQPSKYRITYIIVDLTIDQLTRESLK